jgi:F-type H+-transporting ATPase subunit epsilon
MAEQKLLTLTIARVDGPVFQGDVVSVVLPGTAGTMEILPHHEPLISPLRSGEVKIKKVGGEVETVAIESGTLEVSNNHATVLV